MLELTATPRDVPARRGANRREARHANVLVDIPGRDLWREGMIKMPIALDARQESDWRTTMAAALECLNKLQWRAKVLRSNSNRYIRPIMLVQVERTGREQRDGNNVHALDVQEWLKQAGLEDAEIAIKTADTNDLKNPEN